MPQHRVMKKLIFASAMAALVVACAPKVTTTTSTPSAGTAPAPAAPAPAASNTATAKIEAGHQVYNAKCGRCHALKEPSNYTAERWVPIMQSMAPKAKLNEEETANVMAYVQANAKKA
ncbi:MAG: cytochrome C [Chitinophagaceae bacterium]|nr:MAG: cytochrome C [Chitinophagaceae bacterium]